MNVCCVSHICLYDAWNAKSRHVLSYGILFMALCGLRITSVSADIITVPLCEMFKIFKMLNLIMKNDELSHIPIHLRIAKLTKFYSSK